MPAKGGASNRARASTPGVPSTGPTPRASVLLYELIALQVISNEHRRHIQPSGWDAGGRPAKIKSKRPQCKVQAKFSNFGSMARTVPAILWAFNIRFRS